MTVPHHSIPEKERPFLPRVNGGASRAALVRLSDGDPHPIRSYS